MFILGSVMKLRKRSPECKSAVYYCEDNEGKSIRVTVIILCSAEFQINVRMKVTLCVDVSLNCRTSSFSTALLSFVASPEQR